MANVLFSRTDSPSTKPITDGQIIFDTSGNGKMYLDNGTTRLEMGGAINVDATLDATSTNPIQNKGVAGVMLGELEEIRGVTKKGFLTDALATKTLDAKIGTTDISSIGDGTVTGAISEVNGKLPKEWKLISTVTTLSAIGSGKGLTIPDLSSYKELLILTTLSYFETSETYPIINGHINGIGYARPGCYLGSSNWQTCTIYISDEEINVVDYVKNGTAQTSGFFVTFYIR